jgi:hypothetical protein
VDGEGVLDGAGELDLARLGVALFACFGIEPVALNEAICGVATLTGVTADGAAALSPLPAVALPIPNATPKATTTAATASAAKRPGVIDRCRSRRA